MNFDSLEQFNIKSSKIGEKSFDKICVDSLKLYELLHFLKNNAEFDFDMLNSIIAVDLGVEAKLFELIYDLYSTTTGNVARVSVLIGRSAPSVQSVVDIFKSAYFDECEIFDMFGINFDKNPNLKRLLMPSGWIGHPLRKDYVQADARLAWNDDEIGGENA